MSIADRADIDCRAHNVITISYLNLNHPQAQTWQPGPLVGGNTLWNTRGYEYLIKFGEEYF